MSQAEETIVPEPAASGLNIQTELGKLRSAHGDAILGVTEDVTRNMFWVEVKPRALQGVLKTLRDDRECDFKLLSDLTCVDYPDQAKRFNVLYNLYSISRNRRVFLRVRVAEGEAVPTASGVFASADPAEREVWDLFGVLFEGHPNLTRIMLPDEWQGHPLRKDYPAVGRRPVLLFNDVKDVL